MPENTEAAHNGSELFIGLIATVGTNLRSLSEILTDSLLRIEYKTHPIHVIELLHKTEEWKDVPELPLDQRYISHMDMGDKFREQFGGDALARFAVSAVREFRKAKSRNRNADNLVHRTAYAFRSFKHPQEIDTLRKIYGNGICFIAAYCPADIRLRHLATGIADSHNSPRYQDYIDQARSLMRRDEEDVGKVYGQNVRDTFPKADVFINASDPEKVKESITRFVEILFGQTYHTPTRDEYGMFHARAAALRSASLSRQVGAAICTKEGDIVALGTNEVPKAFGGQYWEDDPPEKDKRDFRLGYDTSDKIKRNNLAQILNELSKKGWFNQEKAQMDPNDRMEAALDFMDHIEAMKAIEYGRSVHAEMAAFLNAARLGISVKGCTLYTTTFPCHDCARHIVATGIDRVVYVEPYPKSLALELHEDSILVDPNPGQNDRVKFGGRLKVGGRGRPDQASAL